MYNHTYSFRSSRELLLKTKTLSTSSSSSSSIPTVSFAHPLDKKCAAPVAAVDTHAPYAVNSFADDSNSAFAAAVAVAVAVVAAVAVVVAFSTDTNIDNYYC